MKNPCIQLKRPDPSSVLHKVYWELENKPSLTEMETSPQFLLTHFTVFGGVTCQCPAIPVSLDLIIGLGADHWSVQQKTPSHGLAFAPRDCRTLSRANN